MSRRARASAQPRRGILGFAWYTRDQWLALKQCAADPEVMNDTYEDWVETATRTFWQLHGMGFDFRRVNVDVSELAEWCRSRGVPLNGGSRAQFTAQKASKIGTIDGRRRG